MKVFFHSRAPGSREWTNKILDVSAVPRIGEAFAWESGHMEVNIIFHIDWCPFEADVEAEVWGLEVPHEWWYLKNKEVDEAFQEVVDRVKQAYPRSESA